MSNLGPEFQNVDLGVTSCYEIGRRVFTGAKALYVRIYFLLRHLNSEAHTVQDSFDTVSTPVTDPSVKGYHTFQDMTFFRFPLPNGTVVQSCPAALGYSFAGGTSDGPGAFDFKQNDNDTNAQNPFWALVSGIISTPTPDQVRILIFPRIISGNILTGDLF